MGKHLVIVESPAKAKTIGKYLGRNYKVIASVGHIIDLPAKKFGVDTEKNFKPQYEIIPGKKKVIDEIKKAARESDSVLLAPDPDREGEAIAWHVAQAIKSTKKGPPVHRVLFNEITKNAIREAINHPLDLNQNMFEAQQARRILDRLVGYQISPLLWEKVRRGLSAGRVQSVAVRLICEREAEIKAFNPQEYWSLEAFLEGSLPPAFMAKLAKEDGKKVELQNGEQTQAVQKEVQAQAFILKSVQRKEQRRNPQPPFITSTLQQEASRKLGFTAKRTMMLAQKLYEGIELESETVGLITYMRTDSTRIADTALTQVREYIGATYGKEFVPPEPLTYKSKKGAQDAHEAVRPTSLEYTPQAVKKFLKREEFRLYELIWKRFVACQMAPAVLDQTVFVIIAGRYEFRASGSVIKFPGFISVYTEDKDEDKNAESQDDEALTLPDLKEGEELKCREFKPSQHFTQPPPRFTEASLVKELEERGIGRPSTYAAILTVIQEKKYVDKIEKKFRPTDLGDIVNNLLVASFPDILAVEFTAKMEAELDEVEEGKLSWVKALDDFYGPFSKTLKEAKAQMRDVKRQEIPTGLTCEKCGNPLVIKFGRNGEFLACQSYPDCKNTKEFRRDVEGKIQIVVEAPTNEVCEKCGAPMIIKRGRFGKFLACSAYPACKSTKAISLGINCPKCAKPLQERRTKKMRVFYGCTGYPGCDFASWDKPVAEKCPDCGNSYLIEKYSKTEGVEIRCPQKECSYQKQQVDSPAS